MLMARTVRQNSSTAAAAGAAATAGEVAAAGAPRSLPPTLPMRRQPLRQRLLQRQLLLKVGSMPIRGAALDQLLGVQVARLESQRPWRWPGAEQISKASGCGL